MEDPRELRKLAEWYRAFAEVGRIEERESRLKLAEYLERRAAELGALMKTKPLTLELAGREHIASAAFNVRLPTKRVVTEPPLPSPALPSAPTIWRWPIFP